MLIKTGSSLRASAPLDFLESWSQLVAQLRGLFTNPSAYSDVSVIQPLSATVYRLCTWPAVNVHLQPSLDHHVACSPTQMALLDRDPQPAALYIMLERFLNDYLHSSVCAALQACSREDLSALSLYSSLWSSFATAGRSLKVIFYYLEKDWISRTRVQIKDGKYADLPGPVPHIVRIESLCCQAWRQQVLQPCSLFLTALAIVVYQTSRSDASLGDHMELAPSAQLGTDDVAQRRANSLVALQTYASSMISLSSESLPVSAQNSVSAVSVPGLSVHGASSSSSRSAIPSILVLSSSEGIVLTSSTNSRVLSLYRQQLEEPLAAANLQEYSNFAVSFLASHSIAELLECVEIRIREDQAFIRRYLHPSSESVLLRGIADGCFRPRKAEIMSQCVAVYLQERDVVGMSRLVKVLLRCDASLLDDVRESIAQHVCADGCARISQLVPGMQLADAALAFAPEASDADLAPSTDAAPTSSSTASSSTAAPQNTVLASSSSSGSGASPVDPVAVVDACFAVYRDWLQFVQHSFGRDSDFLACVATGCTRFMVDGLSNGSGNSASLSASSASAAHTSSALHPNTPLHMPLLLARYSDMILRRSTRDPRLALPEAEVDEKMDVLLTLYRMLPQQDVFDAFYQEFFARRLIQGVSDYDFEERMISRLRSVSRFEYVHKLSRMFQDMRISDDLNRSFHMVDEGRSALDKSDFDMRVTVLTAGSWPLQPLSTPFAVPSMLTVLMTSFDDFYRAQHSGRKVVWLHQSSTAVLRTCFTIESSASSTAGAIPSPEKEKEKPVANGMFYEFQVSTYQLAILLLFNHHESLCMDDILAHTVLTTAIAEPCVRSLVRSKILVLSSRADGKKVFTVNTHFKSPRRRIQLHLMVQLRDPEKEVAAVYESVADDRKSLIQAAIVRIMKARKVHTHVELVGDVIAQVRSRFVPQVADVKENISVMLDREFIRRVDDRTYEYVA